MKKVLLLLFAAQWVATLAMAQTPPPCVRDSNLLTTGQLLSPAAYSPDSPFYNLHLACIGEEYNQSVTVNVPATYTAGTITVPITNVSIPTTGGIKNYPAGLQYLCDPPNCVFNANTLGCILLFGIPAPIPAPDTVDLGLTATVATPFGPFPVIFPGDAAPGNHYYLIVNPMGECMNSTHSDPGSPFSSLGATPNPFSGQTTINASSKQTGSFRFEVFDLLGNRLHTETIQLFEGDNQLIFDAAQLPSGTYFYALGNANGKSVRKMVKL